MFEKCGRLGLPACLLALGLVAVWGNNASQAQVKKGKTRVAETRYLMRGAMQPTCAALGNLAKGKGPKDDKAWEQAVCYTSILNELSYVVMDDGRCPDKDWAGAAKTLRECSSKALTAAKAKDAAELQAAFKGLTAACAACHTAHRKK
jgi:cytochrome c556